jgi:hypothetical protein
MVILRHDNEEGRRSFALGTEPPRRSPAEMRAAPSASGTNPPPDDATPVTSADDLPSGPPARTR